MLETIKNAQFYHTSFFPEPELNILHKKLGYFPEDCILPYLDIFRMFLIHPKCQDMFRKLGGGMQEYTRVLELLKVSKNDNVRVLAMRILCNLFLHEATRLLLTSRRQEIFDVLSNFIDTENKLIKSCLIGLFFKYLKFLNKLSFSVLLYDKIDSDESLQILSLLNEV